MTIKVKWLWNLLGVIILALPGLINVSNRFYYFALLGLGWVIVVFVLRQSVHKQPIDAIILLFTTNFAFWFSYVLWKLRPLIIGPVQSEGVDPFSIAISAWLIALIVCALYEFIVLVRGINKSKQRYLSMLGLVGVLLQFPITLKAIYSLINGI